ncbi:hypothetical protein [Nonomuraea sp. NPDC050643]|uniref:hypothetical protein n=1 Tax=Nonomuraea sp. NPDC050643 TaxID=3155660 RepID=UPI0033D15ACC
MALTLKLLALGALILVGFGAELWLAIVNPALAKPGLFVLAIVVIAAIWRFVRSENSPTRPPE